MRQPEAWSPEGLKQCDAILLAGGQSRRLNRDKVLLHLPTGPVLSNLMDLCLDLFGSVFVVVDRIGRITSPPRGAQVIADEIPAAGPLGGILTGLRASGAERCFVTACDLPFLHRDLVRHIARRISDQDVLVAGRGDSIEPLVGFYSNRCAEVMRAAIAAGDLRVRGFWGRVKTEVLEMDGAFDPSDLATWLLNVNTRHDLEVAEAVAASGTWR